MRPAVVVNILPVYISNSSVEKIQSVIVVCENVLLIGFVTSLAVIFRSHPPRLTRIHITHHMPIDSGLWETIHICS